jgi:hypothetical protein
MRNHLPRGPNGGLNRTPAVPARRQRKLRGGIQTEHRQGSSAEKHRVPRAAGRNRPTRWYRPILPGSKAGEGGH